MAFVDFFFYIFLFTVPQWIMARSFPMVLTPGQDYLFSENNEPYCPKFESNNAIIGLWAFCDADADQSFWKVVQGNQTETFTLVNTKSHLCMTVGIDMHDSGNNAPVVQYECQNPPSANQLWTFEMILPRDRKGRMIGKSNGRCMSFGNREIHMFDCNGSIDQLLVINE